MECEAETLRAIHRLVRYPLRVGAERNLLRAEMGDDNVDIRV